MYSNRRMWIHIYAKKTCAKYFCFFFYKKAAAISSRGLRIGAWFFEKLIPMPFSILFLLCRIGRWYLNYTGWVLSPNKKMQETFFYHKYNRELNAPWKSNGADFLRFSVTKSSSHSRANLYLEKYKGYSHMFCSNITGNIFAFQITCSLFQFV